MTGFNISSLFGGFSSGVFGSINLSDYNMIKSGAYKKLLKAYYAPLKENTTSKKSTTTDKTTEKTKTDTKDSTGLTQMRTEANSLKTAAQDFDKSDVFKQTNGTYDTDKIVSAINKFAKEYNDTIDQSGKVTSKDVAQQVGYMKSMTSTMSNALSKVGITVGTDGKISVNEDTLKKADMKDVKALFSGSHSYASQIANNASAIGSAALRSSSIYTSSGTASGYIASMFDSWA